MSGTATTATVEAVCQRWADAELQMDPDALEALLDERFAAVGPVGFVLDRTAWIGRYRGHQLVNEAFALSELDVRLYDHTAIAIALQTQKATAGGRPTPERVRVTLVLVERDGATGTSWKIAGIHLSFIGAPQGQAA